MTAQIELMALAAERMKREAAEVCGKIDRGELGAAYWNVADCEQAILALPIGYTEAQLDAEAMAGFPESMRHLVEVQFNRLWDHDCRGVSEQQRAAYRADAAVALAVVRSATRPDCCDQCNGHTFAELHDRSGWRCVECKKTFH
jgi:ribosomal protein L37AE/L43A